MPKKHTDQRGFFQELFHFNHDDPKYVQVSWFSIEPGQVRGQHYHLKTEEMFIVLEGTIIFRSGPREYTLQQGERVCSEMGVNHSFRSKEGAKVLAFSTRHYNDNDPDVYTKQSLLLAT